MRNETIITKRHFGCKLKQGGKVIGKEKDKKG